MKNIIIALLICLPFISNAQEARYLNENFNKAEGNFPPYGWRNVDHDGDGRAWNISIDGAPDASGIPTLATTSHIWLFADLYPDNWLVTPQLIVENEADELSYWVGSFEGRPHKGGVYISTTGYDVDDFTQIDEIIFNGTYTNQTRSVSLSDYVGETIYIAFRHEWMETTGIALSIDNVTGPKIKPFDYDLAISGVSGFSESNCDFEDAKITIRIDNLGSKPAGNFKVYYQSQGKVDDEHGHETTSFSDLYSETITQTINAGGSLEFHCSNALPFSEYKTGTVAIRAFIEFEQDEYERNDGYETTFQKQESRTPPFQTGFESGLNEWYVSPRAGNAPFGTGSNEVMANTGSAYLTASVYAPSSGSGAVNGEDAYLATPCFMLDEEKDYRLDFFYAFRKFPAGSDNKKKLNFRLIAGTDRSDLLNDHIVIHESTLESTRPLVMPDVKAEYDLFSSPEFKIPDSGIWYIGLMFYSDDPVTQVKDEWMLFVDDLYFVDTEYERPIDLSLDKVYAPYNCNLSDAEPISILVRNASLIPTTEITARYRINNGEWVTETFADVLEANEQKEFTFSTLADLSSYRKYKVEAAISHEGEEELANNEAMIVTENKRVKDLPFTDDFETYTTISSFEDEYLVTGMGYYTWDIGIDNIGAQTYSYNGEGFLVDALDIEYFTAPDDWIVSCCFQFEEGKKYDISFMYRVETYATAASKLKIQLLSDYDTSSLLESLGELEIRNTNYHEFKAEYKAEEDHIGHLAFHSYGGLGASIIFIDALSIKSAGTAIEEVAASRLAVYPNPATDYITIDAKDDAVKSVELFDLLGKRVGSQYYAGASNTVNLPLIGYAKGNYLLKAVLESGEVVIEKVIVK